MSGLPSAPPPPARIDTYQLISNGSGYRFFAICHPVDSTRPITAWGDTQKSVETLVKERRDV